MIIVTGATGQLGRQIVDQLLTRVSADRIGVSVRDPKKAQTLADQGVRVRQGSFTDPAGLAYAFEGASQVLVISADKMGDEVVRLHRTAIDAAVAAGARRILYTSQMGADATSHFQACRDHAATEAALDASGVPYTSLRNGFYASSALQFLGRAAESGRSPSPRTGRSPGPPTPTSPRRRPRSWPTKAASTAPLPRSPHRRRSPSTTSPTSPPPSPAERSSGSPRPTKSSDSS